MLGYNASKKRAEQAAWEFMKEEKPTFDLTVINPDIIIGPMIHYLAGPRSINQTNHFAIASFIDGTHKDVDSVTFPFYHFVCYYAHILHWNCLRIGSQVDVRDVARAHVDSLTNPKAANQRILLIAGLISPQLVVNIIRKHFPALRDRVPEGNPSQILPKGVHPTGWDMRRSLDILAAGTSAGNWKYIDLENSVVDAVQSMLKAGVI